MDDMDSMEDRFRAIAKHYGVPWSDVAFPPTQGDVNVAAFLGRGLVVRIPRDPSREPDLAKESEVIPVARSAGVTTPAVVEYDASRTLIDVPYMVAERVHAEELGRHQGNPPPSIYREIGSELARLHTVRMSTHGPIPGVSEPWNFDPDPLMNDLVRAGEIGADQGTWLRSWLSLLSTRFSPVEPVLLHADVSPPNVLISGSKLIALLDWGRADWGDPERDFAYLPIGVLPLVIEGYRAASSSSSHVVADSLEARALWYQIFWALARLRKPPRLDEKGHWAVPRQARLLEILRFLATAPPSPWSKLLMP